MHLHTCVRVRVYVFVCMWVAHFLHVWMGMHMFERAVIRARVNVRVLFVRVCERVAGGTVCLHVFRHVSARSPRSSLTGHCAHHDEHVFHIVQ